MFLCRLNVHSSISALARTDDLVSVLISMTLIEIKIINMFPCTVTGIYAHPWRADGRTQAPVGPG